MPGARRLSKPPPPRSPNHLFQKPLPHLRRHTKTLYHLLRQNPRLLLLLPFLAHLLLTTDNLLLWWFRWTLIVPPTPADKLLSHNCPSPNHTLPLVVVIPLIAAQVSRLQWSLARWGDPRFQPCNSPPPYPIHLAFYFDRPLHHPSTAAAVAIVQKTIRDGAPARAVRRCFAEVSYRSAGLSAKETRNSYAIDLVRNLVHTAGSNRQFERAFAVMGGGRFRHMFYMEPDTWPIREGWLAVVQRESLYGEFWMRGTTMRYAPRFNIGFEPFRTRYQRHLNGNAIYRLGDPCFARYRKLVREFYGDAAFDVAMTMFRLGIGRVMTFQEVAFRFQVTRVVVDIGVTTVSEPELLERFPGTYLVHGKYMHVKHPALNFMQYR